MSQIFNVTETPDFYKKYIARTSFRSNSSHFNRFIFKELIQIKFSRVISDQLQVKSPNGALIDDSFSVSAVNCASRPIDSNNTQLPRPTRQTKLPPAGKLPRSTQSNLSFAEANTAELSLGPSSGKLLTEVNVSRKNSNLSQRNSFSEPSGQRHSTSNAALRRNLATQGSLKNASSKPPEKPKVKLKHRSNSLDCLSSEQSDLSSFVLAYNINAHDNVT